MLDDTTLREVFHIRVSMLGVVSVFTLAFVLIIALLSVLIIFTPIRNVLPGYSESLRQQLIQENTGVEPHFIACLLSLAVEVVPFGIEV